jgi:hypothetical protein
VFPTLYNGFIMISSMDEPDDPIYKLTQLGEQLGFLTYKMIDEGLRNAALAPKN